MALNCGALCHGMQVASAAPSQFGCFNSAIFIVELPLLFN